MTEQQQTNAPIAISGFPPITINLDLNTPVGVHREYSDLDEPPYEEAVTLADLAVAEAVRRILDISQTEILRAVRQQVADAVTETIRERVGGMIADVLAQPIGRVDSYGNPRGGEPTTIAEEMRTEVTRWLRGGGDSYGRGNNLTELLRREVDTQFGAELRRTIAEQKNVVIKAVQAKAAEALAGLVTGK